MSKSLKFLLEVLLIHTHANESVIIKDAYYNCALVIDNVVLLIDLLSLNLIEFDIILVWTFGQSIMLMLIVLRKSKVCEARWG